MTGQNIYIKKQINQNNSTWHVLKQIRKQEIIFFFFAAGQKPWKFEQAKKTELIIDFGGQNDTENNIVSILLL